MLGRNLLPGPARLLLRFWSSLRVSILLSREGGSDDRKRNPLYKWWATGSQLFLVTFPASMCLSHSWYFMRNDDIQDWQAFCSGDNTAMERLYARHSPALYSFCLYQSGDRIASDDIVQESFLKLITQRAANTIIRSVRNWLLVTARNLMLNGLRGSPCQSLDHIPDRYLAVDNDHDTMLTIRRILSNLTADEREILLLREHQGYSIREIAEILCLSEENVRVRLFRIRKRIQNDERKLR